MPKRTAEEMIHGVGRAAERQRMMEEARAQWDKMVGSMSSLDRKLQAPCDHSEIAHVDDDEDVCVSCGMKDPVYQMEYEAQCRRDQEEADAKEAQS